LKQTIGVLEANLERSKQDCEFYYAKLRKIEEYVQKFQAELPTNKTLRDIQDILYRATEVREEHQSHSSLL
jgi:hypothetical protein